MPSEQLPVQVVGAVPCNNSYRHVEDFVVFELEEKTCVSVRGDFCSNLSLLY